MRRCVARCSGLLPAHSGSTRRYVRGAAAHTRRYVPQCMHQCGIAARTRLSSTLGVRCSASAAPRPPREKPYATPTTDSRRPATRTRRLGRGVPRPRGMPTKQARRATTPTPPMRRWSMASLADDPLAVYVASSANARQPCAGTRGGRETTRAASAKGGMWWLGQMAGEGDRRRWKPPPAPAAPNARPSRKTSTDARRGLPRQRQRRAAAARRRDTPLGVTAEKVEARADEGHGL